MVIQLIAVACGFLLAEGYSRLVDGYLGPVMGLRDFPARAGLPATKPGVADRGTGDSR